MRHPHPTFIVPLQLSTTNKTWREVAQPSRIHGRLADALTAISYLEREQVLWPDLGVIEGIKVELVLIRRVHGLNVHRPLGVVASSNGILQVLRRVAVVGASDDDSLLLQQELGAAGGLEVELDKRLFTRLVDELGARFLYNSICRQRMQKAVYAQRMIEMFFHAQQ